MQRLRAVLLTDDAGDGADEEGVLRMAPGARPPDAEVVVDLSGRGRKITSAPTFCVLRGSLRQRLAEPGGWSRLGSFDGFLTADPVAYDQALALGLGLRLFAPEPQACDPQDEPGLTRAAQALADRWRSGRAERAAVFDADPIDVVVRTGGRDPRIVRRALASLAAQSAGRLRAVIVRHGPCDLQFVDELINERLVDWTLVEAPGANRARALAAGLEHLRAPRFGLLDDDDHLLEDHVLHLLEALARGRPGLQLAYADILAADPSGETAVWREGVAYAPLGRITDRIAAHAFLADAAALTGLRPDLWTLDTAEDALLIASLLTRADPVHSPHATCVYMRGGSDGSAYLSHPRRTQDELSFALQLAPWRGVVEAKFPQAPPDVPAALEPFFARAHQAALREALAQIEAKGGVFAAVRDDALIRPVAGDVALLVQPQPIAWAPGQGVSVQEGAAGLARVFGGGAFAYAATVALDEPTGVRPLIVAVEVRGGAEPFGIGLLDGEHRLRAEAVVQPVALRQEVQLTWIEPGPAPTIVLRRHADDPHTPLEIFGVALAYPAQAVTADGLRRARETRVIRSPALAALPAGGGVILPVAAADAAVEIRLGSEPWSYAASIALDPSRSRSALKVELQPVDGPVFLLRVDAGWSPVGERLAIPPCRAATAWMEPLTEGEASRLVVQAGERPADERVTLRGVWSYP